MFFSTSTLWRGLCLALLVSLSLLPVGCRSSNPQPFVFDPATALAPQDRLERVDPSARRVAPEADQRREREPSSRSRRSVEEVAVEEEPSESRRRFFRWGGNDEPEPAPPPHMEAGTTLFAGDPLGTTGQPAARVPGSRTENPTTPAVVETFGDRITPEPELRMRPARGYRLQPGDPVQIYLRGIPEPANYEYVIADEGTITLPYIPAIQAAGLTVSELRREIHDTYINEQIYRQITVNVILPTQSYFVRGEVRQPGRYPLTGGMTVLQAIAAAGGYTEFANPRRVEIIRDGETILENARQMEQNPDQDLPVKAGDVIIVRRSIF